VLRVINLELNSTNVSQAHEHYRKHLQSLPAEELGYPLEPTGDVAEVNESQKVTDEPFAQR
jgi:NADH dehydrogenase (ubiquinone) Fe-S protein 6